MLYFVTCRGKILSDMLILYRYIIDIFCLFVLLLYEQSKTKQKIRIEQIFNLTLNFRLFIL